jgi:hypothetical protein
MQMKLSKSRYTYTDGTYVGLLLRTCSTFSWSDTFSTAPQVGNCGASQKQQWQQHQVGPSHIKQLASRSMHCMACCALCSVALLYALAGLGMSDVLPQQ